MRTRIVAVIAALLMFVAIPAWAAEYDGGYKDCPSNENMYVRTSTTYYSKARVDATSGSDYGWVTFSWNTNDWKTRTHWTSAIDGWWSAEGQKLSQFWTWAGCD